MIKFATALFALTFVVFGALGLVTPVLADVNGVPHIFGLFAVGVVPNIVHLLSGVFGLLALRTRRYARWYTQIFGLVFLGMAIDGFLQNDTVLGAFDVNSATNFLHLGVALGMLAAGFLLPEPTPLRRPAPMTAQLK